MSDATRTGVARAARSRPLWAVTAIALGLIGGALVCELGLRLADRLDLVAEWRERRTALASAIWMKSPNPELIYTQRPNYFKDGRRLTERNGILRPDDVESRRSPDAFRIVAVGDSVAAAIKLPYEARMLTRAERTLSSRANRRVEILNFAVNGYDTGQEAELLTSVGSRFSPQAVIVQFCVNDFYPTEYPTWWYQDPPASRLADFLWHRLDRRLLRGYPPTEYWDVLYERDEQGWLDLEAGLTKIASFVEPLAYPPVLILVPELSHDGWTAGAARLRHQRVAALGSRLGFDILDLLPTFEQVDVESVRTDPWDTFHLNERGHRIAGDAIADHLTELLGDELGSRNDGANESAPDVR